VSLTAPYLDPLGAGFIVSISQSLKTAYGKKSLFGVTGADFTVSNFGAMYRKHIGKRCLDSYKKLHCFLVDSNGFIVYHPHFDNAYNDSSKVLNKHITVTDAKIARDLIRSGVMVRRECQNFNLLKLQRFYEIIMDKEIYRSKKTRQPTCDSYAIIKVPGTNVFVIVTKSPDCFSNRPSCPCHDTCTTDKIKTCECPCTTRLKYNFCNSSLTGESDIPVCAQPSPPVSVRPPLKEHPDDLGKCFTVHCGGYKTENDCNAVFGCFWCYKKTDGSLLKTTSCRSDRKCYGGILGRVNPFVLPHKGRRKVKDRKMFTILGLKLNMVTLIAGSSALGLLVLISIVTICCLCRRKAKSGEEEIEFESMDMFAVEEQTQLMDPTAVLNNDQGFGPLQMNYPGQSTMMQSNMQMGLGGPRMNYSTQAMSGMWHQGYGQSQVMSFVPQMSTMQTPGGYSRKPKSKRSRPTKIRKKVSFSNDAQEGAEQEPNAVSEDSPTAGDWGSEVAGNSEVSQDQEISKELEVIDNPEVI